MGARPQDARVPAGTEGGLVSGNGFSRAESSQKVAALAAAEIVQGLQPDAFWHPYGRAKVVPDTKQRMRTRYRSDS
jgi:hypothetical protein